jgi:hypothetical protein
MYRSGIEKQYPNEKRQQRPKRTHGDGHVYSRRDRDDYKEMLNPSPFTSRLPDSTKYMRNPQELGPSGMVTTYIPMRSMKITDNEVTERIFEIGNLKSPKIWRRQI